MRSVVLMLLRVSRRGVVIDTQTKQVVARIPTSEKLIEVDFQSGRPVRAGHR